jgi:hypothetical protein
VITVLGCRFLHDIRVKIARGESSVQGKIIMGHINRSQRNAGDLLAWIVGLLLLAVMLTVVFLPAYLVILTFHAVPHLVFYGLLALTMLLIVGGVWKVSQ